MPRYIIERLDPSPGIFQYQVLTPRQAWEWLQAPCRACRGFWIPPCAPCPICNETHIEPVQNALQSQSSLKILQRLSVALVGQTSSTKVSMAAGETALMIVSQEEIFLVTKLGEEIIGLQTQEEH